MKLTLKISHRDVTTSITASVGRGDGTIKWLGELVLTCSHTVRVYLNFANLNMLSY